MESWMKFVYLFTIITRSLISNLDPTDLRTGHSLSTFYKSTGS